MYPFDWRTSNSFRCARSTKSKVLTWLAITFRPSFFSRYAASGSNRSRFSSMELHTWNATRSGGFGGRKTPFARTAAVPRSRIAKATRENLLNADDPQPGDALPVEEQGGASAARRRQRHPPQRHLRGPGQLHRVPA